MASAVGSNREIYMHSGSSQVRLHQESSAILEANTSLVTTKSPDGNLVTFIVRYSYTENGRNAIATLLDRDIRYEDHLPESDGLGVNEIKIKSLISVEALSVTNASVVVVDTNKVFSSLVDIVALVAKSVFNIETPPENFKKRVCSINSGSYQD